MTFWAFGGRKEVEDFERNEEVIPIIQLNTVTKLLSSIEASCDERMYLKGPERIKNLGFQALIGG